MRPIEIQPTRPTRLTERVAAPVETRPSAKVTEGQQDIEVNLNDMLNAKAPPLDTDRIDQIRKDIRNGTYRIEPAKIADAMIAAGVTLRNSQ